ncbi:hypothetical protein [Dissulfurispira thermophila]|uniref:Uncharacterized protein n=1 Tax=hot springs metagenome TaxID=433727 RepID=A0A5J4KX84_9ZZZZ|nr:hypothetical protein [Dissulfurispira thermophila]
MQSLGKGKKGEDTFYIAWDPVARDTFGAEMFKLMAIFAPLAGLIMLVVRYLMFTDLFLLSHIDDGCNGEHYLEHGSFDRSRNPCSHHELNGSCILYGYCNRQHPYIQLILLLFQ